MTGTIRSITQDKGFGFIQTANSGDFFFHRSSVQDVDFSELRIGQQVEFDEQPRSPKGPRAENVRPVEN